MAVFMANAVALLSYGEVLAIVVVAVVTCVRALCFHRRELASGREEVKSARKVQRGFCSQVLDERSSE